MRIPHPVRKRVVILVRLLPLQVEGTSGEIASLQESLQIKRLHLNVLYSLQSTLLGFNLIGLLSHPLGCVCVCVCVYLFILRQGLPLSPGSSAVAQFRLTATSASRFQVILMPQPPEQLGLQVHATMPS